MTGVSKSFWPVRLASVVGVVALCFALDRVVLAAAPAQYRLLILASLFVILAVSLNLINGITGQFSIGHAAFAMIGAYTAGTLSKNPTFANMPPAQLLAVMTLIGALTAATFGFIVGLPSLRLRGDYLAIVTLGFGEIIRIVTNATESLGGSYGMPVAPKVQLLWWSLLMMAVCIALCRNLLKTTHGLTFLAVREDEVAGLAMGVNVTMTKVVAFVIGAAFAGAAGAILAHTEAFISPRTFPMEMSFIILTMVVLGGTGSITGSALAAVVLFAIPEYLRTLTDAQGKAYEMNAGLFMGVLIGIMIAVAASKWIQTNVHEKGKKLGFYAGAWLAVIPLGFLFQTILHLSPTLKQLSFGIDILRYAVFAVVLIALMLLRPQGIFGHHEIGWHWFRKRPAPATEGGAA